MQCELTLFPRQDWAGRVALLASCQVLGGVSCVLAGLLRPPWVLPLSLAGKFCSSVVFLIVYLYTAEIYPTQLRGCGLALTATMARIGDFIAPYIAGGWAHLLSSAREHGEGDITK